MNHATVTAGFYICLLIVMPVGLALMILWMRKIFKPLTKSVEKSGTRNLQIISFKALIFMLPGIFALLAFSIPVIYFSYLLKQERFCKEVIERNNLTVRNADLEKICGELDINELLENSRVKK